MTPGIDSDERFRQLASRWDDEDGMEDALERARATGGADTFGVMAELDGTPAPEAPLRLREDAPALSGSETAMADVERPSGDAVGPEAPTVRAAPPGQPNPSPGGRKAPSEMDWKELGDALFAAQFGAQGSRAAEHMFANIVPGYKERTDYGEGVAMAKAPLELAKERQGMESRELGMEAQRGQLADRKSASLAKAAENDPNSMVSQKAREAVRNMGLKLPASFDNWSASDVQRFAKTGELARMEEARARAANAAADDQRRAFAGQQKAEAEAQALENSRKAFANELKSLGIDPTRAGQKDIDRAISLRHAKATEGMAASNNAIARSGESRRAGEHEALNNDVPFAGVQLKYRGTGTPREDDRREVQKVASLYGSAIAGMDDLGKALDEFARSPSPETKDNVASKVQVVAGHLNTAAGQGAMSKDEAAIMSAALGADILSPTGLQAMVEKVIGDDPKAAAILTRKLKSVRETARSSAMGKIKAYNYDADAPSGGSKIRVRRKSDGKTGTVLPSDFDPAKYEKL